MKIHRGKDSGSSQEPIWILTLILMLYFSFGKKENLRKSNGTIRKSEKTI